MKKRGKNWFIKSICSFEIILFLSMSFSIVFILSENFVTGQGLAADPRFQDKVAEEIAKQATGKGPPVTNVPTETRGPTELVTDLFKGKAFGDPTLPAGAETGFTGVGLANTLIGALAWAGVAYAVN